MGHAAFALKLLDATNSRDVEAVAGCFADDYVNETPVHPSRGFTGKDHVRQNWERIFTAVPDHTAALVASAQDGDTVWTEWEMRGTRIDGTPHRMCGSIVFTERDERACAARFYLEPVDDPTIVDADAEAGLQRILSR